jgi:hypothetical protein
MGATEEQQRHLQMFNSLADLQLQEIEPDHLGWLCCK